MLREHGMHYDNVNPLTYKNLGATNYAQPFYKGGLEGDMRPTTASVTGHGFDQTNFDVNDREDYDAYEQTNFNVNDREEEDCNQYEATANFDVNERADDDFDTYEPTGVDANEGVGTEGDLGMQTAPTVGTTQEAKASAKPAEENKKAATRPEDRVIKSTGKYDLDAFIEKMGGAANVISQCYI
eukprot:TRINITY_DN1970_c0_g1_i11.p3 TRINITY_DN1970_c0_g1~~TRINITY_DN1970_c0_g1_i11.p3  ORF type:complete len:184 (+),score=62.81 TRINITY_DN1970_c0_g1_i11:1263-1814(+)